MSATVIARVSYEFDTSGLEAANREVEQLDRRMRGLGQGRDSAPSTMRNLSRAAKVATGAIAALGAAFIATAAGVAQWSRATGQARAELKGLVTGSKNTSQELEILGRASAQFGLTQDKVNDQLKDFEDRIGDLMANGTGPLKDIFDRLGDSTTLTAKQLSRMSGTDGMLAVKQAMEEANIPMTEQFTLMEALADEGSKLALVFANNGEELKKAKDRYVDLNLELSKVDRSKLEGLDQAVRDMDDSFNALTNRVMADLAPAFSSMFAWLADGFANADDAIATVTVTTKALWDVFANRAKAVYSLLFEGGLFDSFELSTKGMKEGLLSVTAGFIVIQEYITDGIMKVAEMRQEFDKLSSEAFSKVGTKAKELFNGMIGSFKTVGIYVGAFASGFVTEMTNAFTSVSRNAKIFGDNFIDLITPGSGVSLGSVYEQMQFDLGKGMSTAMRVAGEESKEALEKDYFGSWSTSMEAGFEKLIAGAESSDAADRYRAILAELKADIDAQVKGHAPGDESSDSDSGEDSNSIIGDSANVDSVIDEYTRMGEEVSAVFTSIREKGQTDVRGLSDTMIQFSNEYKNITKLNGKQQAEVIGETAGALKGAFKEGSAAHKAASITQATINGYLAVSNAMANIPAPYNIVAAGVMGGLAAANVAKIVASANGNAFDGGNVQAFANGGTFTNTIATGPTMAPMALFGEAGPEAIMPLTRKNGKLGVQASGGGGVNNSVSVVINGNADPELTKEAVMEAMREVSRDEIANQQRTGGQLNPLAIEDVF